MKGHTGPVRFDIHESVENPHGFRISRAGKFGELPSWLDDDIEELGHGLSDSFRFGAFAKLGSFWLKGDNDLGSEEPSHDS